MDGVGGGRAWGKKNAAESSNLLPPSSRRYLSVVRNNDAMNKPSMIVRPLHRLASTRLGTVSSFVSSTQSCIASCSLSFIELKKPKRILQTGSRLGLQTAVFYTNISLNKRLFSTAKSPKATLRKRIRPFLIACHPDAAYFDEDSEDDGQQTKKKHMSKEAKVVNLKAVQTLNGLIDTCDELIARCTNSSGEGQLPELKAQYEVEFMLPSSSIPSSTDGLSNIKRKNRREELSLRSVVIDFPTSLREEVRQMALTRSSNEDGFYTGMRLRKHVEKELLRLLTVANLEYEGTSADDSIEEDVSLKSQERKQEERWNMSDHFLHELGIEPMEDITPQSSAFYGRNRPKQTPPPGYSLHGLPKKREAFMKSIRWDKFRDLYDEAFKDAVADDTTARMNLYNPRTKEGRDRRERFVSEICSRVEIWMGVDETGDENADIPDGLDVVAQLVAIRRLSAVLLDNFEYLKMEKMGRMWENLVIVFTPPRDGRRRHRVKKVQKVDEKYADVVIKHGSHPGRKLNKWERRMKKREKIASPSRGYMRRVADYHYNYIPNKEQIEQDADDAEIEDEFTQLSAPSQVSESGFKFSYGSQNDQGNGQVTAYVPIDFGDDEVVRQLHIYLYDYFDNVCSGVGFLKLGPDGQLTANVNGVEDDADGKRAAS